MNQDQNPKNSEELLGSQQQSLEYMHVQGDDNTLNVIQSDVVTLNQTQIFQIPTDEIKGHNLNTTSPYKGLRTFEPEDHTRFFGREQCCTGLANELEQTNLILLLGASGSGKSSVVRAGLIPWLSQKWGARFVSFIFTPDQDPFESLYGSLLSRYKQAEACIAKTGEISTFSQVVQTLKKPEDFWLIVIDQFEELFTTSEPKRRDHFIRSLVELCQTRAEDRTLKIIATMRSDFLDRLDPDPANLLVQATSHHRPMITQMNREEVRSAIERPAVQHGVVFESQLVEEIIQDVQGQAGYLPLLQYTLDLLWETELQTDRIFKRTLNLSTYLQLGGVRGALQRRVEQIYRALSKPEKLAAKRIFLRLVEIGGDAESGTEWKPVRRRANRAEFQGKQEQKVLARLIDQNLLVSNSDVLATGTSVAATVEIAHEVLLTSWDTLDSWIKDNRQAIAIRNRLNEDVNRWQVKNEDDELWSGSKLERVLELREDPVFNQVLGGFTTIANQFIDASQQCQAKEKQRWQVLYQEAEQARRKAEVSEIKALVSASKALLISNDQLDALLAAVKAGKLILHTAASENKEQQDLRNFQEVLENLQEVLFKVFEINRFQSTGRLLSISFSPDGEIIAAGSDDKTLQLWNREGQCLKKIEAHSHPILSVCFSPDGQVLASSSADTTIKLWDSDGNLLQTLKGHHAHIWDISFSPNSQMLASVSSDGTIKLWSCNGSLVRTFEGDGKYILSVCFSPDGQTIASAHKDNAVKLWSLDGTLFQVLSLPTCSTDFYSVQFSPNGQVLAAGNGKGKIALWDLDGILLHTLEAHQGEIKNLCFSQDSEMLISASWDRTVKVWSLDGRLLQTFEGHRAPVWGLSYDPQSNMIASSSADTTIRLWNLSSTLYQTLASTSEVWGVSFSPDGQQLASASKDSTIRIWSREGKLLQNLNSHEGIVWGVNFSPDGQLLASSSWDKTIKLWNREGQLLHTLIGHTTEINCVCFSPDGQRLASAAEDGIKLWNREGTLLAVLDDAPKSAYGLSFSPDGKFLASGNTDNTIKLWSCTGTLLRTFKGHESGVQDVSFSPDGQQLASSSVDRTIRLWTIDGTLLHTLRGHTSTVWTVKFSPNGQTLVSGSEDGSIKIWSRDGVLLQTLKGHSSSVWGISFSPDGKILASGSWDHRIFLWDIERTLSFNLEKLLDQGCRWLEHYLKNNPTINVEDRQLCSIGKAIE